MIAAIVAGLLIGFLLPLVFAPFILSGELAEQEERKNRERAE